MLVGIDGAVLGGANAGQIGEAFDEGAAGIFGVHAVLHGLRQPDAHRAVAAAACRDTAVLGIASLVGDEAEQQIGVLGGDVGVLVQIGHRKVQLGIFDLTAQEVQDGLGVVLVGPAVLVHVMLVGNSGTVQGLPPEGSAGARHGGGTEHELSVAGLGEHIGVHLEGQVVLGQVINRKAEAVVALPGGIVAQLHLHLAVRRGAGETGEAAVGRIHHDDGVCGGRQAHIRKAGALLQDGQVIVSGRHGRGGGHQQALGDGADAVAAQVRVQTLDILLPDPLGQDRGKARHVRRGHGGAAVAHVLVRAACGAGACVGSAVHGIDIAAGGADLRLHQQRARNAPGAEVVDGGLGAVEHNALLGVGHLHAAGVIAYAAGSALAAGPGLDLQGVIQGDGHHGEGAGEVGQIHMDGAGLVVGNDHGLGVVALGIFALFHEGKIAAIHDHDLAGETRRCVHFAELLRGADRVDVNIFIGADDGDEFGVCVGRTLFLVAGGLVVEDVQVAVKLHRRAGGEGVLGGGHAEAVHEGAGAAAGVGIRVFNIGGTGGGIVRGRVGVAGGDGQHHLVVVLAVGPAVQVGLISVVKAPSRCAGAQGQVAYVGAKDHGVFNGDHVVRVISAAADAEDLHDQQLGVGRHAHRANLVGRFHIRAAALDVAVGRSDAGHVRAVVAFDIATGSVGDGGGAVYIVVAVRDLGADIVVALAVELAGQAPDFRLGHQLAGGAGLFHRVGKGVLGKGLVAGVNAGVDDGDPAAGAGEAGGPGGSSANHVLAGAGRIRLGDAALIHGQVLILPLDAAHTGDLLDLHHLTEGQVGGNGVHRQGHVPVHVQLMADNALDLSGHGILLGLQPVAISDGVSVAAHTLGAVAGGQRGGAVQEDGSPDHGVQIFPVHGDDLTQVPFLFQTKLPDMDFVRADLFHFQFRVSGNGVFGGILRGILPGCLFRGRDGALGDLRRGLLGFSLICKTGHAQGQDHDHGQQQRKETLPTVVHRNPPLPSRSETGSIFELGRTCFRSLHRKSKLVQGKTSP